MSADLVDSLDRIEGTLRDNVVGQALACLDEPTCDDKAACLEAWILAVFGK